MSTQTLYMEFNEIIAQRISMARVMRMLSMDELCEKMKGVVSKQTLSNYEKGKNAPNSTVLIALADALQVSVDFFFRPFEVDINDVAFRKKSTMRVKRENALREQIRDRIERYLEVEKCLNIAFDANMNNFSTEVEGESDVLAAAKMLKQKWNLGEDGIHNVLETLEDHHIKVIEIDTDTDFDGLSGFVNIEIPFIVVNKNFPAERKRFTALHELGHLVLKIDKSIDEKGVERLCNLFASEMLISAPAIKRELGENRQGISLLELQYLQVKYGVSVEALMYKARHQNIITEERYRYFNIKKNQDKELRDQLRTSRMPQESSTRFEQLVYRALASETASTSNAAVWLGVPVQQIRETLNLL